MSTYRLADLFDECCTSKGRLHVAKDRKNEIYQEVWAALNDWIFETMVSGKGAAMAFFGRLTWRISQKYVGKLGRGNYKEKKRPLFLPSQYLIKSFQLPMKFRDGKGIQLPEDSAFNPTRVAIKYSTILTKDAVFSGVRDLFERLGLVIGTGRDVSIDFSVGTMKAQNRNIVFEFERDLLESMPEGPATLTKINMKPVGKDGVDLPPDKVDEDRADVPTLQLDAEGAVQPTEPEEGEKASPVEEAEAEVEASVVVDDGSPEGDLTMEEEFRLTEDIIGADLSPSMQKAYQRHMRGMQQKILDEQKHLKMFQDNIRSFDEKQYNEYSQRKKREANVTRTLAKQHEQERERKLLSRADRKASVRTTLPVLEQSEGNNGTDPVMGVGEVVTEKELQERRKMKQLLTENIKTRADQAQRAIEKRKEEERRFLAHVQALGNSQDAKRQLKRRQQQALLTASWERDSHLKLLMKQHMPDVPDQIAGGTMHKTQPPDTGRSQFSSVGYDSRR